MPGNQSHHLARGHSILSHIPHIMSNNDNKRKQELFTSFSIFSSNCIWSQMPSWEHNLLNASNRNVSVTVLLPLESLSVLYEFSQLKFWFTKLFQHVWRHIKYWGLYSISWSSAHAARSKPFLDDMRTEQERYFCRCYCKRLIAFVTGVSRGLSQSTGSFPVSGFLYLDVVKMVHS